MFREGGRLAGRPSAVLATGRLEVPQSVPSVDARIVAVVPFNAEPDTSCCLHPYIRPLPTLRLLSGARGINVIYSVAFAGGTRTGVSQVIEGKHRSVTVAPLDTERLSLTIHVDLGRGRNVHAVHS